MSNANAAWDVDDALNRWENIKAEEAKEVRLKVIAKNKESLAYSEAFAQEICERISSGELLICICNDEHMPTVRRVTQWLNQHMEFKGLYDASINDRLTIFEEEVIKIADDASHDFKEVVRNGRTTKVLDGDAIARAKLRVEVRFRHLKAGRPAKWGDQQTIITKSGDEFADMSTEELEKQIADMDKKKSIVKDKAA